MEKARSVSNAKLRYDLVFESDDLQFTKKVMTDKSATYVRLTVLMAQWRDAGLVMERTIVRIPPPLAVFDKYTDFFLSVTTTFSQRSGALTLGPLGGIKVPPPLYVL